MTKPGVSTVLLSAALALAFLGGAPAHAVGFGGLFSSVLGQSSGENGSLDDTLVRMSQKMNRSMPQAVDTDTRLDKVSAEPGHQFAYHYTMLNVRSKDVNTANFYKTFRPTLQKRVCGSEEMKMFFRNRVTVAYAYQGKDGEDIGKIAFSPKDCGFQS